MQRMCATNMAGRRGGSMATAFMLCAMCVAAGLSSASSTEYPENWDWFPGFGGNPPPDHDPYEPPSDGASPPLYPAPEYPPGGDSPPFDDTPPFDGAPPPYDVAPPPSDGGPPFDGGSPPFDGGSPPFDGGSPPFDGGTPPFDGGSPPFDGGSPPFDGGSPPFDGGAPPFDGGSPPFDGGAPPFDGGAPPFDGGSPPFDGAFPPIDSPPFGDSPPIDDGGSPPFYAEPPIYLIDPPTEEPIPWATGYTASFWSSAAEQWPEQYTESTTVSEAFGEEAHHFYGELTLLDALLTTRTDGYSFLIKHATASLFNSNLKGFQYSTYEVKTQFVGALSSEESASVQALKFENANADYNL